MKTEQWIRDRIKEYERLMNDAAKRYDVEEFRFFELKINTLKEVLED